MTIHLRAAAPRPSTYDPQARTIEAIVSTGADVDRPGHVERLDLSGVDLARLTGAPVLDAHRAGSTRDQLGVVEAAELRPEGLWVRLRFRSNEAAQSVLADIGDGTLRGLSMGYKVRQWTEARENGKRVRTALQWAPIEVSLVPIPADPSAHFRNGDNTMPEPAENITTQTGAETVTRAAVNAEIRTIADTAGLTRAWADAQIDAEASAEDARAAAIWLASRGRRSKPRSGSRLMASRSRFASISAAAGWIIAAGSGSADMALPVDELIRLRDQLTRHRASGSRRVVVFSDGRRVEYKADSEMGAAIADLNRQISQASAPRRGGAVTFSTRKGF